MSEEIQNETAPEQAVQAEQAGQAPAKGGKLRSFGKYLGLSVLFCAILLAIVAVLSPVFEPKTNTREAMGVQVRAFGFRAEPEHTLDGIIMGDSLASTGFSPMEMWDQTGLATYVVAANGEQMSYALKLLNEVLNKQSPRVVVFETEMLYTPSVLKRVVKHLVLDQLPFIEYHWRWKELTFDDLLGRTSYEMSFLKGYNAKALSERVDTAGFMAPTADVERPPAVNVLQLHVMAELCRMHGTEFVLVSAPHVAGWSYARHNGIAQVADELGLPYIDLNEAEYAQQIGIDWETDTRDAGYHLNYLGAQKVSVWMAGYLSQTWGLPDRRGDEAYATWDDCLVEYRAYMAEVAAHPEDYDIAGVDVF